MENNTDKELRDKLQSLDFPFDPTAWEQMESKLEEDRKPKGFMWWWFGGIAASLLIVAGMYGHYHHNTGMNNHNTNLTSNKPSSYNNDNTFISGKAKTTYNPSVATSANNSNLASPEAPNSPYNEPATNNHPTNRGTRANNLSLLSPSSQKSKHLGTNLAVSSAHLLEAKRGSLIKRHKSMDQLNGASIKAIAQSNKSGLSSINSSRISKGLPSLVPEAANTETAQACAELKGMSCMQASELTYVRENDLMRKQEEVDVNLKKLNKKIFHYSLGALANVTGSVLGGKGIASSKDYVFAHTPSYMAGFTHDFTFINRFAITNSVLFSRTSFTVPNAYSSTITELTISIGFKGYVVSKSKFRFYLGTGIINHIKLKETYVYRGIPIYNSQTGTVPQSITQSFVPNSYNGASELSINYIHRYYASLYASAGVESVIHKHLILFAEPLFYMSLQKVGLSNYHQYNLGLSGGFRYQF